MANGWGNNGNSDRLYLLGGSKITVDGDCSHEIKRYLLLGRKVMTNLDSVFKSRDIILPTMREIQVQSLGWEDLLEKEMAPHSSILAWKIPWMEEPGGLQSMGLQSQT